MERGVAPVTVFLPVGGCFHGLGTELGLGYTTDTSGYWARYWLKNSTPLHVGGVVHRESQGSLTIQV